jgi:Ca2+-binding EF-hand superfamily protein
MKMDGKIEVIFRAIDHNHDGRISLQDMFQLFGDKFTSQEIQELFNRIDKDKDDHINFGIIMTFD